MTENLQAVFTLNDSAFARGTDRILSMLTRIEQRTAKVGRSQQESFESPLGSLNRLTGGLLAVDKALSLFKQGLQIVSDFQRLDASLGAVSSSSIDFARTQAFLRKLSDDLGVSYEALAGSYKGLKAATNGTVLEGQATERIFSSVVKAGAALKLSNEDIKGTLMALSQMVSKGTISMEELRQQLGERLPGAMGLAAKAMGVSTSELNKMVASGDVLASDLLPKLADQLEKTYGNQAQSNINTMAGGWTRATDQLKLYIAEFSKTKGIDSFFAKIANGFANIIKDERRSMSGSLASEMEAFNALSPDKQRSRLANLYIQYSKANYDLGKLSEAAPTKENLAKETQLGKRVEFMRQLYGQMYQIVKAGEEKAKQAQIAAQNKTVDPIEYLDKQKKRFDYLTQRKQGLSLLGQDLPVKEASELAKLKSQLENAGVRKVPKDSYTSPSSLDILENVRKATAEKIQNSRALLGVVSPEDVHLLEEVETQIKRIKGEVDDGSIKTLKSRGDFQDALGELIKAGAGPSLSLPDAGPLTTQIQKISKDIADAYAQMKATIKSAATETAIDMASGLGEVIGGIATGQLSILGGIIGLITDFLSTYLNKIAQAKLVAGAALIAAGALTFDPITIAQGTRNLQAGGLLKVAAGAVRVVGGSLATGANAKGYEKGGLFTGESFIRVAETSKARAGGGELVTSVQKGTDLIGSRIAKELGLGGPSQLPQRASHPSSPNSLTDLLRSASGGGNFTVEHRVESDALILVISRGIQKKNALGGGFSWPT